MPLNIEKVDPLIKAFLKNKKAIITGDYNLKLLLKKPKERSISELMVICDYYYKRRDIGCDNLQSFIKKKIMKNKNIPNNRYDGKSVYYKYDDTYYEVNIRYNSQFKSYGYSQSRVNDMNREQTLDFLTLHDDCFSMGETFLKLEENTKSLLLSIVQRELDKELDLFLDEHFKDKDEIPKSFIIEINNTKYIVRLIDRYTYRKRFEILNELDLNNIITI